MKGKRPNICICIHKNKNAAYKQTSTNTANELEQIELPSFYSMGEIKAKIETTPDIEEEEENTYHNTTTGSNLKMQ